jgi:putative heme-binding domain-containing protein
MQRLPRLRRFHCLVAFLALILGTGVVRYALAQAGGGSAAGARLEIKPGDHISIIGNTLADRMQHDGWLETYLATRFPQLDLVFRNLGFAADEVTIRLRSANFGSPDDWLMRNKTDVVFAFFGYNESFAGEKGLPKFQQDLDSFVKYTLKQKYNGKEAPRLVLFSPTAHEDLHNPNLPDGSENNKRLALYTAAIADVAKANNVPFVDLFSASKGLFGKAARPLTINGIHLTDQGNQLLAEAIDQALFPNTAAPKRPTELMEKVRQAVLDKNFVWFNRYRTVDGYSIYGGRAGLTFTEFDPKTGNQVQIKDPKTGKLVPKINTNREVAQREMEMLDIMTGNRDKRVWAVAKGGDLKVDDSNTPDFVTIGTNLKGPLMPGNRHIFLDPDEEIAKLTVAKGLKVNLFASEKMFPELTNAVQMSFDPKGRLWVAVWPTYPHWKPKEPMNDKILILEDTDGDGKADKCTVFADGLHCPTGFEFWNGGVLVAQAPDIVFLKGTDNPDKADTKLRVLSGVDSADTHHTSNSFVLDPGGALYFQEGTFHHTQVETPWGPPARCVNAGVFRYEPRTQKFDVYVAYGFANPHGHVFDRWGLDIVVDGTGANPYHAALFSGQVDYPQRHPHPPQVYNPKTRPCPGMEILSSRHFPDAMQGNLLVANVIGFRGILQYKLEDRGASVIGKELEPIVSSSDPNFRPSDLRIGPDGAIYFLDWHNPIIGHMQHNLRDPNRDREHGRIYRVTCVDRPLLKPAKIAGEPIDKLLDLLKEPEDRVRYRTRIELTGRDTGAVIPAVEKWAAALDRNDANYEHHMLEALWLHQSHNVVNEGLLKRMLRSPDFRARSAATRVLCYWRDRVHDPLELLRVQINDAHPRVRLEAIRALSFFPVSQTANAGPESQAEAATNVALELLTHPDDEYLRFVFNETLNTLERRAGAMLDRKNIAASLVSMLDKGKVPAERQAALVETICRHGDAKELTAMWQKAARTEGFPPALRKRVLEWLADAATTRRAMPKATDGVVKLLGEADAALLPAAIHLAAAWKAQDATATLCALARSAKTPALARVAAIDALPTMAAAPSLKTLDDLTASDQPTAIRFRAAAALARLNLDAAAAAAARALATSAETDDPGALVQSFLVRKDGSDRLAAALGKEKVSADAAKRILRAMYLAGRNDKALGDVASRFAGLDAAPRPPTAQEIVTLGAEAMAKGDAARGERVFRRADLGCIKCHAIGKAGGNIGPDLGPVGGAAPLDYIVQSILDPNASIKEEYLTKVISTVSGQVVTGIVVERSKNQVVLKDATGKLVRIPAADIDDEANGKSLMPEGVTRILTRPELLDLIRFVSELGKPGAYHARAANTVGRWKKLRDVPPALADGVPNLDVIRDTVLRAGPEAWDTLYATVNGTLPMDDVQKSGVAYLQADVQIVQAGPVEVRVDGGMFWVDDQAFENKTSGMVTLTPGRHRITVRVAGGVSSLRCELRKPADSRAHFEIVMAD